MKNKLFALLMCGAMAVSVLAGCGNTEAVQNSAEKSSVEENSEEKESSVASDSITDEPTEKTYDKLITFTSNGRGTIAGVDYTSKDDPFYKYVSEKFNIEIENIVYPAADQAGKVSLWANAGTLPDMTLFGDYNYSVLMEMADQGLLQPLPEDWKEKWPNLAKMVEFTMLEEAMTIDGQLYAIPHASFGNYFDGTKSGGNTAMYIRKDWAEQIGMADIGDDLKITLSELKEYLQKIEEAGILEDATLGSRNNFIGQVFLFAHGLDINQFAKRDNEFVWNFGVEGIKDAITEMQTWYQEGWLHPDYYTRTIEDFRNDFVSGVSAALFDAASPGVIEVNFDNYKTAFPDRDPFEDIQVLVVAAEDGTTYVNSAGNQYLATVFAPETDAETMERILDVMDWTCSIEGQAAFELGVPEVDWTTDSEGNFVVLNPEFNSEFATSYKIMGYADDFSFCTTIVGKEQPYLEIAKPLYELKAEGVVFPYQVEYNNHVSEAKSNYSLNNYNAIAGIVVGGGNVDTEWDKYMEENRNIWEPLLNELNETYCK